MADVTTPVLIVGGGPVGLAASICLSRFGVPSVLVERHAATTTHPRATVVNTRTFELFRQWEVEAAVRAGGLPPEKSRYVLWATTLAGFELGRLDLFAGRAGADNGSAGASSPSFTSICPQDVYELILRRAAAAAPGASVRFHTELAAFDAGDTGVDAVLRSLDDGRERRVRAQYLLACDGAGSGIREQLGIAMPGPDNIGNLLNVYFHADLTRFIAGREGALYWIVNAEHAGVFIALDNVRRWLFNTPFRLAEGERLTDFTPERCRAIVRRAIGDDTVAIDIRSIDPWIMRSQVAERYRVGRVFLVGDAAHRFPPTGGFGMNTGVQDAHNLAWKLAGVLGGWAPSALLDTYEPERRPVGQFNADQSYKNVRRMPATGPAVEGSPLAVIEHDTLEGAAARAMIAAGIGQTREHFSAQGQAKGFAYESAAIVADGTPAGEARRSSIEEYVPSARPGSLAPHMWVRHDGRRGSLLDLFDTRFVVLAGPDGAPWCRAVAAVSEGGATPLVAHLIGDDVLLDEPPAAWCTLYGVEPDGAVLVRPDGHVAWRARSGAVDPVAALRAAYAAATGHVDSP